MSNHPPARASSNPATATGRVLGPQDGDILGAVTAVRDRFMVEGEKSGGGFSLIEHLMPPRALAAPLHRHSREDEYSFVLEGRVGTHFDGMEAFGQLSSGHPAMQAINPQVVALMVSHGPVRR